MAAGGGWKASKQQLSEAKTEIIISQIAAIYLAWCICHVTDMFLYYLDILQKLQMDQDESSTIGDESTGPSAINSE